MPLFLQFRLWLREGPARERVLAASAAVIAVVLLALASLPVTDDDGEATDAATSVLSGPAGAGDVVGGGAGPADAGAGGADATADPVTAGSAAGAPGGGPAPAGPAGGQQAATETAPSGAPAVEPCGDLRASAPGISAREVLLGAAIVNLAGPVGNTAFNIRPDMHEIVDVVVDHINKTGGVACGRKLVVKKYDVNPIDENDQQAKCLQMVQDKVFAVVDFAGYARPVGRTCFVQNKLPHQVSTSSTQVDLEKGYPYLYGEPATSEKQVRDGILGLAEIGFFAPPKFQKLGLLVDTCDPSVRAEIDASLRKVGIDPDQVSRYTLNCALVAPPNEVLQGVVQHKAAGATHVFLASSLSNNQRYTTLARQQDYSPTYGVSDYGTATSSAGSWDRAFAGAIGVTSTRRGELNSGVKNPRVQECERIITAAGLRGIATERDDGAGLSICDGLWFVRKALAKAGANPTRASLVEVGVGTIGRHESGGGSDGVFERPGKVSGGDFYRFLQFDGGCACWKLRDPNFKRGH